MPVMPAWALKPEAGSFGINYRLLTAFRPYGLFRIVVPSPDDNLDNAQSFYGSTSPSFRRPLLFSLCCRSAFPFPGRKFRISSSFSFRSGCFMIRLYPISKIFNCQELFTSMWIIFFAWHNIVNRIKYKTRKSKNFLKKQSKKTVSIYYLKVFCRLRSPCGAQAKGFRESHRLWR